LVQVVVDQAALLDLTVMVTSNGLAVAVVAGQGVVLQQL
jgi:hypothetical protein